MAFSQRVEAVGCLRTMRRHHQKQDGRVKASKRSQASCGLLVAMIHSTLPSPNTTKYGMGACKSRVH